MKRILFCFFILLGASAVAQKSTVRVDMFFARFCVMQVKSNFYNLALNYTDNDPYTPHVIYKSLSQSEPSPLYGVEYGMYGVRARNNIAIEGLFGSMLFGRKSEFFSLSSGLGYDVTLSDKINLTAMLSTGYSEYIATLGTFTHGNSHGYIDVHGKYIFGDVEVAINHYSWYALPKLMLRYKIIGIVNAQLTAGYRTDILSFERLRFGEVRYNVMAKTSTHEGLQDHGQYISKNCFSLSGVNLSLGVTLTIDDW